MIGVGDIINHQTEEILLLRAQVESRDIEIRNLREYIAYMESQLIRIANEL